MEILVCSICGGTNFTDHKVLWPELIVEWQLSRQEHDYVDKQQGCSCSACGASLRIVALGNAIRSITQSTFPLRHAIKSGALNDWRLLDCNGAESISAALSVLPSYQRANYPEYDMRNLPFEDGSFDLVIHSDTLEHIEHPVVALQECRRVLAPGGRLCFTVPIIHGRLTRDRAGLVPSYHGDPSALRGDFVVHTEFGADAWTFVHKAGFTHTTLNQVQFPSAIAITAWTEPCLQMPDINE